jgi:hypothetical protein
VLGYHGTASTKKVAPPKVDPKGACIFKPATASKKLVSSKAATKRARATPKANIRRNRYPLTRKLLFETNIIYRKMKRVLRKRNETCLTSVLELVAESLKSLGI